MTDAPAFSVAAICLGSIGLATGVTLRVLRRAWCAPMLAVLIASVMPQIAACTLRRDWFDLFWGFGVTALALGLLAWDARGRG